MTAPLGLAVTVVPAMAVVREEMHRAQDSSSR